MLSSPGPKYALPTLTGNEKHDLTKHQEPSSVILNRAKSGSVPLVPGPKYLCTNVTRRGIDTSPAAIVCRRHSSKGVGLDSPGPLKYMPQLKADGKYRHAPEAIIGYPFYNPSRKTIIPGPKYMIPGGIGQENIDLPNTPAWSLGNRTNFRSPLPKVPFTPGPGKYGLPDPEVYMEKPPGSVLAGKRKSRDHLDGLKPGPKYEFDFNKFLREPPAYSFGVRHSPNQRLYRHPMDDPKHHGL